MLFVKAYENIKCYRRAILFSDGLYERTGSKMAGKAWTKKSRLPEATGTVLGFVESE